MLSRVFICLIVWFFHVGRECILRLTCKVAYYQTRALEVVSLLVYTELVSFECTPFLLGILSFVSGVIRDGLTY